MKSLVVWVKYISQGTTAPMSGGFYKVRQDDKEIIVFIHQILEIRWHIGSDLSKYIEVRCAIVTDAEISADKDVYGWGTR